jgi:hypothetical protein
MNNSEWPKSQLTQNVSLVNTFGFKPASQIAERYNISIEGRALNMETSFQTIFINSMSTNELYVRLYNSLYISVRFHNIFRS